MSESGEIVAVLQEIARLTNLYLGGGCCADHQQQTVNKLQDELAKFEDDSFTTLKIQPASSPLRREHPKDKS